MKKLLSSILAITILITVSVGCSNQLKSSKVPVIGIVQIVEHPSLNTIRTSFIDELKALGYTEGTNIKIDYQNAQGDQSNLNTICNKFVGDKVDLIVAIATPSALAAASATKDIPVLFSAVTDPMYSKLVSDMENPGGNVSGVSDAIPVDLIFGLAKDLTPTVKKFGFIYNLSESNSVSVINNAKKYCDANNIQYTEATITNTSEMQQVAQSLASKSDAIFSPIDNTVASAMPILSEVCKKAKIPMYTGADSMVDDGGFATFGINYVDLGKETAAMAKKVLEGTEIGSLPVKTMTNFRKYINKKTADAIGVTLSQEVSQEATIVE